MSNGSDVLRVLVPPTIEAVTERTVLTGPTGFTSHKPKQQRICKVRRLTSGNVNV